MLHRLVRWDVLDIAEPGPGAVGRPEQRLLEARRQAMLPAASGPPALLGVAAIGDEGLPFGVGNGKAVDAERRQVDNMGWPLVVQRPRLVLAVDAEHELAGRHQERVVRHITPAR